MGWTSWTSTDADRATDNAAIEVIRAGTMKQVEINGKLKAYREPDVQVAEYAAPVDYRAFAAAIVAIAKLYRGNSDEEGCLVNCEFGPGVNIAVFAELWDRLGYTNIYQQPYLNVPGGSQRKNNYGFWANHTDNMLAWQKGVRHIHTGSLRMNSPWLIEELKDADRDAFCSLSKRPRHDDRFKALLIGLWALNAWTMFQDDVDSTTLQTIGTSDVPPCSQRQLISADAARSRDEEWWATLETEAGGSSDTGVSYTNPFNELPTWKKGEG